MKKNFFNIILCVFMLLAFTACEPINMEETLPEKPHVPTVPAEPAEVTATVTINVSEASSRTVLPSELVKANSYDITLTNKSDSSKTYRTTVSDSTAVTFTCVAIGEYTVTVNAYIRNSGANDVLLYNGTSDLSVTVDGNNTCSVQLKALSSGEGLTGSINITIDWTAEAAKEGVIKDVVSRNGVKVRFHFAEDYSANDYHPTYAVKDEKDIGIGTTSAVFTTTGLPVTGKGIGYFSVTYEVDGTEYLLFNIGYEAFQIYSGQVSVPDNADLYVVKSDNVPAEVNAIRVTLGYGADPTKDLKVTWTESEGNVQIYKSVTLKLFDVTNGAHNQIESVTVVSTASKATAEHIFEHKMQEGHGYRVEAFAKTPYGRQTKTFVSDIFQPKVPVTGVEINESTIPTEYMVNGESFTLSATVTPVTATDKKLSWSFSNGDIFDVVSNDAVSNTVSLIAKKPGQTTIKATSADDGTKTDTASKTVSIRLRKPLTPEIEVVQVDGGKVIRVSWGVNDSWAEAYEVYRVVNGTMEEIPVATVSTSDNSETVYEDRNIVTSTSYAYKVKAINNKLKTDNFDPASELSDVSAATTPVQTTITLVQPTIQKFTLQINNGTGAASEILVTPAQSQTLTIPDAIDGIVRYTWLVNGTKIKTGTDFDVVKSIELTSTMDAVQIRGGDANVLTLIAEDVAGCAHSASISFRVVAVADTGVVITNPIDQYIPLGSGTYQINAYVVPENATMQGITYSSSNPAVAEVSSTGLITLKSIGNVTITAEPSYGEAAIMTFEVYNAIDAENLVRLINTAISPDLKKINEKMGTIGVGYKDWWTSTRITETSGNITANNSHSNGNIFSKTQNPGSITISSFSINSNEFGIISNVRTDTPLRTYAYDSKDDGNRTVDPLWYIGYDKDNTNGGSIKATLPYGQGEVTVYLCSIDVRNGLGSYNVSFGDNGVEPINYADVAGSHPIF